MFVEMDRINDFIFIIIELYYLIIRFNKKAILTPNIKTKSKEKIITK